MNTLGVAPFLLVLALALGLGCKPAGQPQAPLSPEATTFAARREGQARQLADKLQIKVSNDVWAYFEAAQKGNLPEVMRLWEKLKKRAGQYEGSRADPAVTTEVWQLVLETQLACEQFGLGEPKYAAAFGRGIIESIPPGSIYFGGTDPGRGLVTTLCKSQEAGDPFFTVTQNALADGLYLSYLREIYGDRIHVPTAEESQQAFQEYLHDAQRRLQEHELKPGENVKVAGERVIVSGQVAVMAINGLLAKLIFDQNPGREFFIEESFPLDWMYPHLVPHGLIMAIRREPVEAISAAEVEKDTAFWTERLAPMVGGWLKLETPVSEVCGFADKVFFRHDLAGFSGDPKYIGNTNACQMFSKLRSSIGGVYAWRAKEASNPPERKRMVEAADFAFRQAFALCPSSPEAVFRYTDLLVKEKRPGDALEVAQTALKMSPGNVQLKQLAAQLRNR